MILMSKIPVDKVTKAAYSGLDTFVKAGGTYFGDNTDEKLVDFISALRHLADRYGFYWDGLLKKADQLYQMDKQESKP